MSMSVAALIIFMLALATDPERASQLTLRDGVEITIHSVDNYTVLCQEDGLYKC